MVTTPSSTSDTAARLRLAIVRTARRLRQEASADEHDSLSPTLTAALATIERYGPLTPSELAERERVQRPTATRTIANLEASGLIGRTDDPADGRGCLVSSTSEGRSLLKRLRGRKNAYIARRLKRLEADEIETLERAAGILERMLEDDGGRG
jgi:DNA-binding MarR family transcriptional regulator